MKRIILVLSVLLSAVSAFAQTGIPPFSSLSTTPFDTVDNQNLNIYFAIPIVSSAGRGMPLSLSLINNSLIWQQSANSWTPVVDSLGNPTWGWQKDIPAGGFVKYVSTTSAPVKCEPGGQFYTITYYSSFSYIDVLGTSHGFPISYRQSQCPAQNGGARTGYAFDSTGFYMDATNPNNPKVTNNGGALPLNGTGPSTDINGNYVTKTIVNSSETDWTDSVGNVALKVIYVPNVTSPTSIEYEFLTGANSSTYQTITLKLQNLNIKTDFACSGIGEYTGTATVPLELDIPSPVSGTLVYSFKYESTPNNSNYSTGRVQKVIFPTGGYYEYDYGATNDGINCADGTTLNVNRVVSNGSPSTWNFVRNAASLMTTVTTPQLADTLSANDTMYTFNSSGQETSRIIYSNSPGSTALRTINTTWATNGTLATQVTILEDGATKSEADTTYDQYGNLQELVEYDWGSGAHGSTNPIRTTSYSYLSTSSYTSLNILNLVTQKQITDSNGTVQYLQNITYDGATLTCPANAAQHNDTSYPCTAIYRGDPTLITTYTTPAGPSGPITKNFTYDWFGNLLTAQVNCCQQKTWVYSNTTQYSQPDSVTSGGLLTTSATYNLYTGWMVTSTDENGQITHYGYDFLRRPMSVQRPDGTTISQSYSDTSFTSTVITPIDSAGHKIQQISAVDSLGYPAQSKIEDAGSTVYSVTQTSNNLLGRPYQTSNPDTGSPSYWTVNKFDALGRLTSTTLPDTSVTSHSYSTNTVTVTDPASKKRESIFDAAGRLTSVYEPDGSNSLTVLTSYAYTVLDGLATVTEGSQTRTYTYDGLGRLLTRAEPETKNAGGQGQYVYQYNSYDLVTQRTDPRGVIATYGYDTLNRLHTISYNVGSTGVSATAGVTLTYGTNPTQNNNGRLIAMADGVGSENYTYDVLGRLTQLQKVISGTPYTTSYQYNVGNELTQITYPSGRVVQQAVDPIGRVCAVAQTASSCTAGTNIYANDYNYNNPASQLQGFNYGNGVAASFTYSPDRLQMTGLSYANGTSTLFSLNYWYKKDATNCPTGAIGNNGQIQCITDNVDNGRTAKYAYDNLARLSTAQTTGSTGYAAWGLSMTFDRYGNRNAQTVTVGTAPSSSATADVTTNRLTTGYSYDSNGNMTNDGSNTLTYDAENRAVTSSGSLGSGSYTYDGNSLRVTKLAGGTTTVYVFSGSAVIAEYVNGAVPASPTREYIYSSSTLLAKIESGATQYYHPDHLSVRLMTDSSGNKLGEQGHYPFGESWYLTNTTTKWQFTDYERDAESGNDYAYERFYVNRLGRFSALDPMGGSTADPQSLNRYMYGRNDPMNMIDPTGMEDCQDLSDDTCGGSGGGGGGGSSLASGGGSTATCGNCGQQVCASVQGVSTGCSTAPPPSPSEPGILDTSNSGVNPADGPGILQASGGGGGGPIGTIGGRVAKTILTPNQLKTLADCIKQIFNVDLNVFSPSNPGQNGNFTGTTSNGSQISITNDVNTFTAAQINVVLYHTPAPPVGATGFTADGPRATQYGPSWLPSWLQFGYAYRTFSPTTNYSGSDLAAGYLFATQVHELGHSLAWTLGLAPPNKEDAYAGKLQDCYNQNAKR